MSVYISPTGNPEVWDKKPDGYMTEDEWAAAHPAPPPPPPTPKEMQQIFIDAIQAHLDRFARTRGYDGIMSAATYATSTVPKFAAEGQYAVEARDATWSKAYEILDEVIAGTRPMPGIEDKPAILAELPELRWPE